MKIPERKKIPRRLGIIEFPAEYPFEDELGVREAIYEVVVPLKSQYENSLSFFPIDRMICYSELFRETAIGEAIPTYEVVLYYKDGILQVESLTEKT